MTKSKLRLLLLSCAAVGLATGQAAYAGFSVGDSVTMGGDRIFQILGSADGVSAEHRAWQTQDALDNALVLAQDRSPASVTVSRQNDAVTVLLGGRLIATADANSASLENMTVPELADKWAQSIRGFLADQPRTAAYVATLVGEHKVHASVVLSERTLYAPAGFTFPITLATGFSSDTVRAGDKIEATVDRDAPLGYYAISSGSVLSGEIIEGQGNSLGIRFTSIRTPKGTVVAINAIVMDDNLVTTVGPHLVSTQIIPAGSANGVPYVDCRVPAGMGVGTLGENERHLFAFRRDSGVIAVGRPLKLVFETVTPVAVIMRETTF